MDSFVDFSPFPCRQYIRTHSSALRSDGFLAWARAVRACVEANGGTVVQLLGDGVMCAFGVPRVAEDDALPAVRAAVEIQRVFCEFARREGAVADRIVSRRNPT